MNRAAMVPSEMMHCTDMMTVLERQKARLKWLQQQEERLQQQEERLQQQVQQESYFGDLGGGVFLMTQNNEFAGGGLGDVVTRSVKPDPALVDKVWTSTAHDMVVPGFGPCGHGESTGSGVDMNYAISRTSSCPPMAAAAAAAAAARNKECVESESKMSSGIVRESFKKRKADKVVAEEKTRDKRIQGCAGEGESKITGRTNNKSSGCNKINSSSNNKTTKSNKDNSAETSKDNSKVTDAQKTDYIHVRARRGQATDSHSLAERVRREKISERMKYLQDLVPGCNKITGKAGMLDEIINYVQSLQRQVEFLSMKLAAVNPRLDFNIDSLFSKEDFSACGTNFPTTGLSSDMTNPAYLQLNPVQQQLVTCCGLDMGVVNPPEMGVRRTISSPISDTFLDSSCFNQIQPPSTWGADLQNLYNVAFDQGRSTSFPHQAFAGSIGDSNLKMEI